MARIVREFTVVESRTARDAGLTPEDWRVPGATLRPVRTGRLLAELVGFWRSGQDGVHTLIKRADSLGVKQRQQTLPHVVGLGERS